MSYQLSSYHKIVWGRRDRDRIQSVPINSGVLNSNFDQGEVYNIVIKFVSDLRHVGGFLHQ